MGTGRHFYFTPGIDALTVRATADCTVVWGTAFLGMPRRRRPAARNEFSGAGALRQRMPSVCGASTGCCGSPSAISWLCVLLLVMVGAFPRDRLLLQLLLLVGIFGGSVRLA